MVQQFGLSRFHFSGVTPPKSTPRQHLPESSAYRNLKVGKSRINKSGKLLKNIYRLANLRTNHIIKHAPNFNLQGGSPVKEDLRGIELALLLALACAGPSSFFEMRTAFGDFFETSWKRIPEVVTTTPVWRRMLETNFPSPHGGALARSGNLFGRWCDRSWKPARALCPPDEQRSQM